jgi:chromosome condensin MukBEF ATPase and DNA-binding subunit MukB
MQGVQYKNTHPDVYMMFSLDSDPESELAKSAKKAKEFKGIVREVDQPENDLKNLKKPLKRPKKQVTVIAPDLNFDEKRREEEREKALKAKFENNETMRMLIKATGDALLIQNCGSGAPAKPDILLMRVRETIGK